MRSKQPPTIVQPEGWRRPKGYSNGILTEGRTVFIAGQVGRDPTGASLSFPPTFAAQFDQTLANVMAVVAAAGGTPDQVARFTIYVTDKQEYLSALKEVGEAWRRHLGSYFPAISLVQVAGLVDDEAKVEIEATAVL